VAVVDSGQKLPAGHAVQLLAMPSEYEPGVHGTGRTVASEHDVPAGQAMQKPVLPGGDQYPVGHAFSVCRGSTVQLKPAGHASQPSKPARLRV